MNTTHTPGPWSVWDFDGAGLAVGPVEGGLAVAEIVTCNAHGIRTKETEERGEANASLIAAAPNLLAALKRAQYHLEGQEYLDAMAVIRAAIERATGGRP